MNRQVILRCPIRNTSLLFLCFLFLFSCTADTEKNSKFYFGKGNKKGFTKITEQTVYGLDSSYGYDLNSIPYGNNPFFFSVDLPEGNYKVTVVLGDKKRPTNTTIKSESRRLMLENIDVPKGKFVTKSFSVNIRNTNIDAENYVRIKSREIGKLNWDDKLTIEVNGKQPGLQSIVIESVSIPTLFLAGNSTVVDQDNEPWCGWGQILPRFIKSDMAVANYAESGESASSFVWSRRFAKILTNMKDGDYLMIEFGHNDQKQKGGNKGPYTNYKETLKFMIKETRNKGGIPILITPMHRRRFDESNKIVNTLGDYPDAMRQLSEEENVVLVDLNKMSKTLYEAWGPEDSKKAFVHYPAGTFPGQTDALADNTHFSVYGGYQLCKCVIRGLFDNDSPLTKYIVDDYFDFSPAYPDDIGVFFIPSTPSYSVEKPDGD